MYTGLLHSHKLFVLLFVLHYTIKLVLLLMNKKETLEKYSKPTRIPEMIISTGFLVTGVWMMMTGTAFTTLIVVKLLCVFSSIPLAVIGFKRSNKLLATLAVVLIFMSYGLAEMNRAKKAGGKIDTSSIENPIEAGKLIYTNSCVTCHGADGNLGLSGAKKLPETTLTREEQIALIKNGKNAMPAYKNLTDAQVEAVVDYVATMKGQ